MKAAKPSPCCLLLVLTIIFSLPGASVLADCPGNLADRADVAVNPAGADYDVYFTDDNVASADYFPRAAAEWVRDALVSSHDIYIDPLHGFRTPYFNDSPNDTCIFDSANTASAPHGRITVDSPHLRSSTEPFIRSAVAHELFHHVQYHYINYNDWPSWGGWTVEGTARLMEDKITLDNDITAGNTWYVGEVNGYLANPNRTLMDLSYPTALFWNYLTEQLGTTLTEPARGVDVIENFWRHTDGHDPDSVKYLRETIHSFDAGLSLEDVFRDFGITNYTHDLDVSGLATPDRYRYFDETAAGGGTVYDAVARQNIPAASFNTALAGNVVRWGARYFEINVPTEKQCEAVGVWGKAKDDKTLSWALVGVKAGNEVSTIYKGSGNSFYRALINASSAPYTKLALVVVGRHDSADFDYAFGSGAMTGQIRLPTIDNQAYVGSPSDPERFLVRLLLQGPAVLTPTGTGTVSMKGIDASLLKVTLRSADTDNTYSAQIINSSYVSGEYWLVVQAPNITEAVDGDLFDLEICTCDLQGDCAQLLVRQKSVYYGTLTRNQMLVLDRSYSMHYPEADPKLAAAKNAARLYVNAAAGDDRLGLVTFKGNKSECDDDAQLKFHLKTVGGNRDGLINEIDKIEEDGWTSIGDGLKHGRDELMTATDPADRHALVLLSDGLENEGDYWAKTNAACGTPAVKDSFDPVTGFAADVRIDTVAFGADADQNLLQTIAAFTGGDYYYVSTDSAVASAASTPTADGRLHPPLSASPPVSSLLVPNRLAQVYRTIEEETHGQDRLFYEAHSVSAGVDLTFAIPVTEQKGGGVRDALFAFNWNLDKASVKIELRDPHGNPIEDGTAGWTLLRNATNATFHYDGTLEPGDWEATIQSDQDLQLIAMLSGRILHGVDLDLRFSQVKAPKPSTKCEKAFNYNYLRGLPVAILVNVNDAKGGVEGLQVVAIVENPDGSNNRLSLYDDGGHEDGLAGDGIYGNLYTRTYWFSNGGVPDFPEGPPSGENGSYNVTVAVSGESNYGEKFQRYAGRSFQIFEFNTKTDGAGCNPDTDGDGLPDRWEDLYGLDKTNAADANTDPDGDGLKNKDEFFHGTLPRVADTDLGGEADGTEVKNGRDPLFDQDDLLPPIVDYGIVTERTCIPVHEPRPNTNIIHFPVNPSYKVMEIWRRSPGSLAFSRIAQVDLKTSRSGVYYDKKLTNGKKYSYYLVARGESGAKTARTAVFSGTPKADPLPPKGWVMINRGATRTDSLKVRLLLDTSDDATMVKISQKPDLSGAAWQTLKPEIKFTLTPTGADPFVATVYVKFRDAALNVSTLYTDSIIVDRTGDFDSDGKINSVDTDDDGDGLSDTNEVANADFFPFGYDPFNADSDGNGVKDGSEDFDRDLLSNAYEIKRGLDPGRNLADLNHDGNFTKADVTLFNFYYSAKDSRADVNGDGKINRIDKTVFQKAYDNEMKYR